MKRFVQGLCIALCLLIGGAPVSALEGEPDAQADIVGYSRSLIESDEAAEQAPDITVLAGMDWCCSPSWSTAGINF